ncbi:signal peptidase II [Candidatus Oleimmundimicrobium sp.]|uniref:signal peptidase II n=1 Tax=Candidatus Oleimmundimicrobium sp. TaxID=3060597 RepID=UPI0027268580|nr:signal peptidase II [Candidatus Oleimmundimicrobium sp.]MDO8886477.1 signal peptidase II [Candidatus Oleimmundimicrobium sp.]
MILILVSFSTFLFDQLTKLYIRQNFSVGESAPVIDNIFHITYVQNNGAAFGLIPNQQTVLFFITFFVILIIAVFSIISRPKEISMQLALGLILGGAVGNLLDRLLIGTITDFLDFRIWPVFNVADSAIVIGTIILLWTIKIGVKFKKT